MFVQCHVIFKYKKEWLDTKMVTIPCILQVQQDQQRSWSQSDAVFLFDTNVPGLPYRSPTTNPTNLELVQVR